MTFRIIYREIEGIKMTQFLDADKIVFDDVTVDCCVTCKVDKLMSLDSARKIDLFQEKQILEHEATLLNNIMKYVIILNFPSY